MEFIWLTTSYILYLLIYDFIIFNINFLIYGY